MNDYQELVKRLRGKHKEASAAIAIVVEECARVAEGIFPRGSAHTYANENAYIYIAQEKACEKCAAAIRKLGETE